MEEGIRIFIYLERSGSSYTQRTFCIKKTIRCTHPLFQQQAEHPTGHRMQLIEQMLRLTTQKKQASHFDLPVFIFHFLVKNTKQNPDGRFLWKNYTIAQVMIAIL